MICDQILILKLGTDSRWRKASPSTKKTSDWTTEAALCYHF